MEEHKRDQADAAATSGGSSDSPDFQGRSDLKASGDCQPSGRKDESQDDKGQAGAGVEAFMVCDSDMKILSIDPRFAGSCHDGHVWRNSGLRKRFMSGRIVVRDGDFLLGE
ncbi:hypothetical protein HPB52_009137 [Rhipicephalus sanguineus]|uniref:DDE Tnp4 domain-containing protein n=1 Tax=Rhipicephalus sanguineus TaxID=34632 RepID=A0A9D4PPA2_RHISA|nr:hypothetical protein HPB52_009137 [Rhipicephalus sanguineus]